MWIYVGSRTIQAHITKDDLFKLRSSYHPHFIISSKGKLYTNEDCLVLSVRSPVAKSSTISSSQGNASSETHEDSFKVTSTNS